MPDPTTDPTPTPMPRTPRLAEAQAHLTELAEAAELGRHWAGRAYLAHLGRRPDAAMDATADARTAIAAAGRALDAAQLAILGLDADPVADLAPVPIEVTDEDVDAIREVFTEDLGGSILPVETAAAMLAAFARRLVARGAAPVPPQPVTDSGAAARLVITRDDVEVADRAWRSDRTCGPYGQMRLALETYALRIQHGLASGTAAPAEPDVDQADEVLELIKRGTGRP